MNAANPWVTCYNVFQEHLRRYVPWQRHDPKTLRSKAEAKRSSGTTLSRIICDPVQIF
jgi:hypothetical protein